MLNRMCVRRPGSCRNMYVMIVHGRTKISAGTNTNARVNQGSVYCRKKTTTFATISRRTQGVTRSSSRKTLDCNLAQFPSLGYLLAHVLTFHTRFRGGAGAHRPAHQAHAPA